MSAQQLITEHIDLWTSSVKSKNTQGRGSSKKRELYGIKKLRELILELAVRGSLVPQDPSDEPASELLNKIAHEKVKLLKEGKIKKQKPLAPIKEEDKPFALPAGWGYSKFGKIIERISNGYSGKQDKSGDGYPVTRIETISNSEINFEKLGYVPEIPQEKLEYYRLIKGDILLSHINSDYHVGKTALYDGERELFHGVNLILIRLHSAVSNEYVNLFLNKIRLTGYFISIAQHAIGQSSINQSKIVEVLVPLPPIDEQYRIVAKVDELMALCDQLEQQTESSIESHNLLVDTLLTTLTDAHDAKELSDNWARLADHFDTLITTDYAVEQLKQTILQLAVQGKLVPQDPNDEPARELLKRIAAEKERLIKDKKIKKQKPLPEIRDEDKLLELPAGWEFCRWYDIAEKIGDIDHKMPEEVSDGIPYVSPRDFYPNNIIDFANSKKIKRTDFERLAQKIQPKRDDIIFPRYGTIGANVLVETDRDFLASYSCCVIKTLEKFVDPKYQFFYSISGVVTEQCRKAENKTTQANVGIKSIQEFIVPLPPLNEQHRIVTKVDELLTRCAQLKTRLNDAQTTQLHLADAIIEQAIY
jgi:type I restriction enzyme S subunit